MLKKIFVNHTFLIFLFFYIIYFLLLIYRSSFLVNGERHFILADDMMISMKYAKNFAEGHGLVWNVGQKIEGITNPLWTLYMSFWHLFSIPASKISFPIQLTNVFLVVLNLFVVKKISEVVSKKSLFVIIFSVCLTATYYPINVFAVLGLETALLSLIICTAILLSLQALRQKSFNLLIYLLLALGTFVRMDTAVPYIAILLFFFMFDKKKRGIHLKWGIGILLSALFLQTGLRLFYYGDILPNTYYLKMTGYPIFYRITRGAFELLKYIFDTGVILFLIPLVLLQKISKEIIFLFFVFSSLVLYTIYTGGDAFYDPGRFITIGMPIFFILFALASKKILYSVFQNTSKVKIISFAYLLFIVIMFNFPSEEFFLQTLLLKTPSHVGGAKVNVEMAYEIEKLTDKDAVIAVAIAGTIPYFTDRTYIDLLGKSDKRIAREESREPYGERAKFPKFVQFFPGHTKWDNDYAIKELKPDILVGPPDDFDKIYDYLDKNYDTITVGYGIIYLKKGYKKSIEQ